MSVHLSIYLSVYVSINLSDHLSIYLFICLCISLSVFLFVSIKGKETTFGSSKRILGIAIPLKVCSDCILLIFR